MQAAVQAHPTAAMPGTTRPAGNLRAILRRRGFRRLLLIRLSGQLGDGWFQAGLASSVLFNPEKAASPAAIAMAFAVLLAAVLAALARSSGCSWTVGAGGPRCSWRAPFGPCSSCRPPCSCGTVARTCCSSWSR